ncbi:MAG: hypothetical protein A2Y38_16055 [Spirochaetes bacterium GWB1_59_5]|nr:MAG: hypothetical protein A2Y38_16055 [Spirochaetes bacterium GWB1_59_5]
MMILDSSARFQRGMARLALIYLATGCSPFLLLYLVPELRDSGFNPLPGTLKMGSILAWQFCFLLRSRDLVLRGGNLEHMWGWANQVTLARGVLLAGLGVFLFVPEPAGAGSWIPAVLYAVAGAADFLDGYIAKRTDTRTEMGALLDGHLDGIGILISFSLAVQYGHLPVPFLALGLAKPLYYLYITIHTWLGGQTRGLPPSYMRRRLAGFLMGLAAAVLWPGIDSSIAILGAGLVGIPFLVGFLRDALAVSMRFDTQNPEYQAWRGKIGRTLFGRLPLLLHITAGLSVITRVALYATMPIRGGAVVLAGVLVFSLVVIAVGRPKKLFAPACMVFLSVEVFRSSGTGLDITGALSLASALALFIFRPWRTDR